MASLKVVAITDSPSEGATDIKRLLLLLEDYKGRGLCMISERYIFDNSSALCVDPSLSTMRPAYPTQSK